MADSESKPLVLTLPDDSVCEIRFSDNRKVVILPPGKESGWHKASEAYVMTAVTPVYLERFDEDGQPLEPVVMQAGQTLHRPAGTAHNVKNSTDDFIVLRKERVSDAETFVADVPSDQPTRYSN